MHDVYGKDSPIYHFNIAIYGKDAVMGDLEPIKKITSHEIGLVWSRFRLFFDQSVLIVCRLVRIAALLVRSARKLGQNAYRSAQNVRRTPHEAVEILLSLRCVGFELFF